MKTSLSDLQKQNAIGQCLYAIFMSVAFYKSHYKIIQGG